MINFRNIINKTFGKNDETVPMFTDVDELEDFKISKRTSEEKEYGVYLISVLATLKRYLEDNKLGELKEIRPSVLTKDGVVNYSCQIGLGKVNRYLYIYNEISQADLNILKYVNSKLPKKYHMFHLGLLEIESDNDVPHITLSSVLDSIKINEGDEGDGTFSLWSPNNNGKKFSGSKVQKIYADIYKNIDGIESYVFAAILSQLGMSKDSFRVKLSDVRVSLVGPGSENIYLSVSQEKGIRFSFDYANTDMDYIINFLFNLNVGILGYRDIVIRKGLPLDESGEERSINWFSALVSSVKEIEKKEDMQGIGVVLNLKEDQK
ncbi:MAG: hypothetical protein ACI83O_000818 [Patescibacteria group bacterium]|jgi:hypothetical protein